MGALDGSATPNLFVLGAMRSGTTSLYRYFSAHPMAFMCTPKEPSTLAFGDLRPDYRGPGDEWFNKSIIVSRAAYLRLFEGANTPLRGDASAIYLYTPTAWAALRDFAPRSFGIVVLRNPVDRAYSSFQYQRSRGREPLADFASALKAEQSRIEMNWSPMWHYLGASRYGDQIRNLLKVFENRRLTFISYDDLKDRGPAVLDRFFDERGLPRLQPASVASVHNRAGNSSRTWSASLLRSTPWKRQMRRALPVAARQRIDRYTARARQRTEESMTAYEPLASDLRDLLSARFAEDIRITCELTGIDFRERA